MHKRLPLSETTAAHLKPAGAIAASDPNRPEFDKSFWWHKLPRNLPMGSPADEAEHVTVELDSSDESQIQRLRELVSEAKGRLPDGV